MENFIFYTWEGYTESPTGKTVENMQILGFAKGKRETEAKKILLNENSWNIENGFKQEKIKSRKIFE